MRSQIAQLDRNGCSELHLPVPTGGYRVTPPSGVFVNDIYIPGNTTIVAPKYSIGRLETCYESPNQLIPERWTTQQDMVKDKRSFPPFSQEWRECYLT
ncbi:hypothetical protein F4860DRAFT_69272 [Xylaria cubensis]|nr:hypothetical protein F4860DRAFT_69272 [Xylaria cubensis]